MAYPACVSMSQGVVSMGGENKDQSVKDVFLFRLADGQINGENLPDSPKAISSACAATIGSEIFVAGGLIV